MAKMMIDEAADFGGHSCSPSPWQTRNAHLTARLASSEPDSRQIKFSISHRGHSRRALVADRPPQKVAAFLFGSMLSPGRSPSCDSPLPGDTENIRTALKLPATRNSRARQRVCNI
jgi:hypothetical protein